MSRQRASSLILLLVMLFVLLAPGPTFSSTQTFDEYIYQQTEARVYELYRQIEHDWGLWLDSQEMQPLAFSVIAHSPNLLMSNSCAGTGHVTQMAIYCKLDKQIVIDSFFAGFARQGIFFDEQIMPPNDVVLAFVIAHEFGHGYLRTMDYFNLMESSTLVEEQAADCMGGVWLGWQVQNGELPEGNLLYVEAFLESLGKSPTIDQVSHGSAAERIAAVQIGVSSADPHTCVGTYLEQ